MVTLPRSVYDAMLAHVQDGYPNEACGILARDGQREIRHYPARNAAEEPETFSIIDGPELLKIWDEIDRNDWTLLAYYHSHPRTQAYPSPRDIQYAQGWPGTYYLIFTLMDPASPVLRAFLIEGEIVTEHEIFLEDA